jgi:hypothetical protein
MIKLPLAVLAGAALALSVQTASATQFGITSVDKTVDNDAPNGPSLAPTFGTEDVQTGDVNGATDPRNTAGSDYFSVGAGGVSAFVLSLSSSFKFLWGTPDVYNTVNFYKTGVGLIASITGDEIGPDFNNFFVSITTDTPFDVVQFESSGDAFEFDNVSAVAVPLPAAGAGLPLLAGLAGYFAWRRRTTA